jgi:hypothetical protein
MMDPSKEPKYIHYFEDVEENASVIPLNASTSNVTQPDSIANSNTDALCPPPVKTFFAPAPLHPGHSANITAPSMDTWIQVENRNTRANRSRSNNAQISEGISTKSMQKSKFLPRSHFKITTLISPNSLCSLYNTLVARLEFYPSVIHPSLISLYPRC